jgi:cell fate regulator YaaT (PSP1 superfamily)
VFLPLSGAAPAVDEFDPVPLADDAWDAEGTLTRLVPVRLDEGGRVVECDAGDLALGRGEPVTVEGEGGPSVGFVVGAARRALVRHRPPRVLRRSSDDDVRHEARVRQREHELCRAARRVVRQLRLPVKVVRAVVAQGGGRAVLYYASDDRIDYREFLRRLSATVQVRIELRQVGLRDAARALGGVGPCGLQLCCNTFLRDFAPVSIKMAKDQGLALTPQRVSGVCGRLLCCLVYEEAFYRQERARYPKVGKRVSTPQGIGKVRDCDVLAQLVRVVLESGEMASFAPEDVTPAPAPPPPGRKNAPPAG